MAQVVVLKRRDGEHVKAAARAKLARLGKVTPGLARAPEGQHQLTHQRRGAIVENCTLVVVVERDVRVRITRSEGVLMAPWRCSDVERFGCNQVSRVSAPDPGACLAGTASRSHASGTAAANGPGAPTVDAPTASVGDPATVVNAPAVFHSVGRFTPGTSVAGAD